MIFEVGDNIIVSKDASGFFGRQKKIVGEITKIVRINSIFKIRNKRISYYEVRCVGLNGTFRIEPQYVLRAATPNEVEKKRLHYFLERI